MQAGKLRELVAFEAANEVDDGGGGVPGDFAEIFRAHAAFRWLTGTEPVIGQRLQGVQPVVVTVRDQAAARAVTSAWRIHDIRRGTVLAIRAPKPSDKPGHIDFLCDTGRPGDG